MDIGSGPHFEVGFGVIRVCGKRPKISESGIRKARAPGAEGFISCVYAEGIFFVVGDAEGGCVLGQTTLFETVYSAAV